METLKLLKFIKFLHYAMNAYKFSIKLEFIKNI